MFFFDCTNNRIKFEAMKKLFLLAFLVFFSCIKDEPPRYLLSVKANTGGSVSSLEGDYAEGKSVTLSATPDAEYQFVNWNSGSTQNPMTIIMNANQIYFANFEKVKYGLTLSLQGEGTISEELVYSGRTDYNSGSIVRLTAAPALGYSFTGWSGDLTSTNNPVEVDITLAKSITAVFEQKFLNTGLPVVFINTVSSLINKEEYVEGSVSIFGGENFNDMIETPIKIKGRGNSTWLQGEIWGKKPYQIKFSNKTQVLDLPKDKKWVLLAELSDKSLIRNKISQEMGKISRFDYVPKSEYSDVYLNNSHIGTYLITQKVEESKNRVNIGDNGYLIEIDQIYRVDRGDVYFKTSLWSDYPDNIFNIKEPEIEIDSDKYNLIKNHINSFESILYGENFTDPISGYRNFIDMPSFVDWYLIHEISKSVDAAYYSSIYFNYVPGEKIKMGPIWDFDVSYGNLDFNTSAMGVAGFHVKKNKWFKRLFEDPYFHNEVKERFKYYEANKLELINKIDFFANYLEKSQEKNFELWPILGVYVWPNPVFYDTYIEEVNHLKDWIKKRMYWLKNNL